MLHPNKEVLIEDAIIFLIQRFSKTGNNPKPVIFHSIKVGIHLYDLGHGKSIVISGLLHDVVEDSDTTIDEIRNKFGKDISELVSSLTFDNNIENRKKRYLENFNRIKTAGKGALIVKAADFIDNSNYYHLSKDEDEHELMLFKVNHFLDNSKNIIGNETVWDELKKRVNSLNTNY